MQGLAWQTSLPAKRFFYLSLPLNLLSLSGVGNSHFKYLSLQRGFSFAVSISNNVENRVLAVVCFLPTNVKKLIIASFY